MQYTFRNFEVTRLISVQPSISKSEAESLGVREHVIGKSSLNVNDRCWSIDGQHIVSLYVLCRDYFTPEEGQSSGSGSIKFDIKNNPPLYYLVNGILIRVGLECDFEWTNEIIEKPVSILTYEQNEFGVLAWVAEVVHDSPKGKVVIRIPIIKIGEKYLVRSVYTELPGETQVSFSIISAKK